MSRTARIMFVGFSLLVLLLSLWAGITMTNVKGGDYDVYRETLRFVHGWVQLICLPYFLFGVYACFSLARRSSGSSAWGLRLLGVGSAFMSLWTLMLSGAIDMSEVYVAWIVAALLLGTAVACFKDSRVKIDAEVPSQSSHPD